MKKKLKRLFITSMACGWCCLPLLAQADQQMTTDAKSLAIMDRVLEYCGPIDPSAAAKLRDKIKGLTKGLTEQQVADLRATPEYQAASSSIAEFVGKVDEHNAKKICSESVSQNH